MTHGTAPRMWAKVTTQFEFLHCWPEAPHEVSFLRNLHRHMAHVTVWVEQKHDHRDVEYILLKRWLDDFLTNYHFEERTSCETVARRIWLALDQKYKYPDRALKVEVTEDGENGAVLETEPVQRDGE